LRKKNYVERNERVTGVGFLTPLPLILLKKGRQLNSTKEKVEMTKDKVRLENLRKMVGELESKIQILEKQKELYLLKIQKLESKAQQAKDEEE